MVFGDSYGSEVEIQYFTEKKGSSSQKYLQSEREYFDFYGKPELCKVVAHFMISTGYILFC